MPKTPDYRTGAAQWDGALPHVLQFDRVVAAGGSAVQSIEAIAACDGVIESIPLNLLETGGAPTALVNLTKNGVEIISNYSVNGAALGVYDLLEEVAEADRKLQKGDLLQFEIEDTAAGEFVAAIVVLPQL